MKSDIKEKLSLVLRTLDSIEVKGRGNIDMLLGCMLTLEQIIKDEGDDANG